jgi:hypothetical protein
VAPQASTIASYVATQHLDVDVLAHGGVGAELGALGLHLLEPPVDVALLHLELGDAVAQQAADAVGALEHHDVVPGAGELLGRARPAGPDPMTATRLPVARWAAGV